MPASKHSGRRPDHHFRGHHSANSGSGSSQAVRRWQQGEDGRHRESAGQRALSYAAATTMTGKHIAPMLFEEPY